MTVPHRWPEEEEPVRQPSRYSENIKRRLTSASLLLLVIGCVVLFMMLFHSILPDNYMLSFLLCVVFTGLVLCALFFFRRWLRNRPEKRGGDPYHRDPEE